MHTLALEAGDVGGEGPGPSPGGTRKQSEDPGWEDKRGPVHLATDVDFIQIKKQIPDSSRPDGQMGLAVVYEMVQKYRAEYLGV